MAKVLMMGGEPDMASRLPSSVDGGLSSGIGTCILEMKTTKTSQAHSRLSLLGLARPDPDTDPDTDTPAFRPMLRLRLSQCLPRHEISEMDCLGIVQERYYLCLCLSVGICAL